MPFFSGRYEYSLDDRGRIPLPPAYREYLAGGITLEVVPGRCVRVHTRESFEKMAQLHTTVAPTTHKGSILRHGFFPNCYSADLDKQGRLLIPVQLRQRASLEGAVLVVGAGEYLELWSPTGYEQWQREVVQAEYGRSLESVELRQ